MKTIKLHKSTGPGKPMQFSRSRSGNGGAGQSTHLSLAGTDQYLTRLEHIANNPTKGAIQKVSKEEEEETVQKKGTGVIQLSQLGADRARIRQNRNNRNRLLLVLLVIAANIANGAYMLEDVDDLLEEPDQVRLRDEVKEKKARQEELRAQRQQQNRQQRDMRRQFNNRGKKFGGR